MSSTRLARLTDLMKSFNLEAIALNPGPTLTYLTGLHFHLMERPTVLLYSTRAGLSLVLPELEMAKLEGQELSIKTFAYGDNPATWVGVFGQAVEWMGWSSPTIGVEPNRFRFLELSMLQSALPQAHFISAEAALSTLRLQKDAEEVAAMQEAVRIAQQAFEKTLPAIKVGVSEREIAAELSLQLLRAGSDSEMPFSPIVASGPNSANPHAVPSERKIQAGDLIVVDWGATYQGYISDLTRTVAVRPIEPEFEKIAQIVLAANRAGCAEARQGIPAGQVDRATRAVIDQAGYGAAFFHRTGHGIGMEGHEPPYIFGDNAQVLGSGMAFTVEPGIYLTGRGGVRIEDNVVITSSGAEVLTDLPRELWMV